MKVFFCVILLEFLGIKLIFFVWRNDGNRATFYVVWHEKNNQPTLGDYNAIIKEILYFVKKEYKAGPVGVRFVIKAIVKLRLWKLPT